MAAHKIQLILEVIDKGSATVKRFSSNLTGQVKAMADRSAGRIKGLSRAFTTGLGGAIRGVGRSLLSLKTLAISALAGWGIKKLAQDFIKTGSSMDMMRLSLDTITKGQGEEWFRKLNEWAMKMPINTEKAIQSFIMMRAMGLRPTIDDMTVLVDTVSALGGQEGDLEGIARALGQIQAKGKGSAEELMQLAERGVPVFEILKEKLRLTGAQIQDIGNQGIGAGAIIKAITEGLAERFGGQSARIQNTWKGLMESLKGYWTDFKRMVMASDVMKSLETGLSRVIAKLDELYKSGTLKEWAAKIGSAVVEIVAKVVEAIGLMPQAFYRVKEAVYSVREGIGYMGKEAVMAVAYLAAMSRPIDAAKMAVFGLRGTFPTLSKAYDYFRKIQMGAKGVMDEAIASQLEMGKFREKLSGIAATIRSYGKEKTGDAAEGARRRSILAERQESRRYILQTQKMEGAAQREQTGLAIKQAEAEKKELESMLREFQSFYNSLQGMIERNYALEKKHIEELNALYRQKMDIQKSAEEKVRSLREIGMSEEERYRSQREALDKQFQLTIKFSGQERIKALEEYKQAMASFGQAWSKGIGEGGDIEGKRIVESAIFNIERATAIQKDALLGLKREKQRQIETDRTWGAVLKQSASEAADEIEKVESVIKGLSAQIKQMQKEIGIKAKDEATPVLRRIQAEMAEIKDKTVTITVKHLGEGSSVMPLTEKINQILGMYQQIPTDFIMNADFSSITSGISTMMDLAERIRFQRAMAVWTRQHGDLMALQDMTTLWNIGKAALLAQFQSPGAGGQQESVGYKTYYYFRDIVINVSNAEAPHSPEDWRRIVRDYIIPELKAANA